MNLVALFAGLVFGIGLLISGMADPWRVKGFLDIAGAWQPALAFVMGSALLVTCPVFRALRREGRPSAAQSLARLAARPVDAALIAGAILFGLGWGLLGLCPGPALVLAGIGEPVALLFLVAVLAAHRLTSLVRGHRRAGRPT